MFRRVISGSITTGAAVLFLASCGEVNETRPSGAGGEGGTSVSSSSSSSSSGAGGAGGAGPCANAGVIYYNELIMGDLATTGQQDFYRFPGKKGDVVEVSIGAQGLVEGAEYDPTYIDSIVTLFTADGDRVALNDDPIEYSINDSRLYTILPADGDYCIRVEECWTAVSSLGTSCQGEKDKLVTNYALYLSEFIDGPSDAETAEVEAGDDAAAAIPIGYEKSFGGIYWTTFWGTFKDQSDIDVWSFTMPVDLEPPPPAGVRTIGRFFINMPDGSSGSGSTMPTGRVWVTDAAMPDVVLAEVDAAKSPDLMPRLELGKPYLLFVERPAGPMGSNDFYLIRHRPGWSWPFEIEVGTGANDAPSTAQPFEGGIEGNLPMDVGDVDHFVATAPDTMSNTITKARAGCIAWGEGSGLRGLSFALLTADGSPLPNAESEKETADESVYVQGVDVEPKAKVVIKVKADSQDPAVAQNFYRCFIEFVPL